MATTDRALQGLVVKISSYRKGKNGKVLSSRAAKEGRNGKTGKRAVVKDRAGVVLATFIEPTFAAVSEKVRGTFNISPSLKIATKGETWF